MRAILRSARIKGRIGSDTAAMKELLAAVGHAWNSAAVHGSDNEHWKAHRLSEIEDIVYRITPNPSSQTWWNFWKTAHWGAFRLMTFLEKGDVKRRRLETTTGAVERYNKERKSSAVQKGGSLADCLQKEVGLQLHARTAVEHSLRHGTVRHGDAGQARGRKKKRRRKESTQHAEDQIMNAPPATAVQETVWASQQLQQEPAAASRPSAPKAVLVRSAADAELDGATDADSDGACSDRGSSWAETAWSALVSAAAEDGPEGEEEADVAAEAAAGGGGRAEMEVETQAGKEEEEDDVLITKVVEGGSQKVAPGEDHGPLSFEEKMGALVAKQDEEDDALITKVVKGGAKRSLRGRTKTSCPGRTLRKCFPMRESQEQRLPWSGSAGLSPRTGRRARRRPT